MLIKSDLQAKKPEELISIIQSLENERLKAALDLEVATKQISSQNILINCLQEQVKLLKYGTFGSKSEKYLDIQEQGRLFDEANLPSNLEEIELAEADIAVAAYTKKKPGRKPIREDLPRIEVIHDLPVAEKQCHCGCKLSHVGDDRTEQLDIIPAKIQVIVHVNKKYACKQCKSNIKTAKKPKQPIPKSIATPGLLAFILSQKFQFHLPLYRQEQQLQAIGIDIPRATLSHWVIKCGELLTPLVNLLEDEILNYDVAYADETTVQVLKEKDKPPSSKSYMWCFAGGSPGKFGLVYQYHRDRTHQRAMDFFADFKGYLHCDGYMAYDSLSKTNKAVKQVACWYHVRRSTPRSA